MSNLRGCCGTPRHLAHDEFCVHGLCEENRDFAARLAAAERALSDAREALRLAQSALDSLMGDTDPYSETPALRAMQAIAAALPAPSTEGDCSALINSVETPPAPVPPGETTPGCVCPVERVRREVRACPVHGERKP